MDAAPFDRGHLLGCHRVVLHRCEEFLVLSKPKPRVYELGGAECVSSGVAPLDAGVLEMVGGGGEDSFGLSAWV